jgi:hypothetical protein
MYLVSETPGNESNWSDQMIQISTNNRNPQDKDVKNSKAETKTKEQKKKKKKKKGKQSTQQTVNQNPRLRKNSAI